MTSADTKHTIGKKRFHHRMHGAVKHHYYKRMPDKKHHRVLIWTVFFVVSGIIAGQLLYPPYRALPLVKLQDEQVGFWQEADIAFRVQESFSDMNLALTVGDGEVVESDLASIGGEPRASQIITDLTEYPFWQRFVPGSILFHWHTVEEVEITYNQLIFNEFSEEASEALSVEPQNARLSITDGEVVATDDTLGSFVAPDDVRDAVWQYQYTLGEKVELSFETDERRADTTAGDLAAVRYEAEMALSRPLYLVIEDEQIEPTAEQRANWIELVRDDDDAVALRFDNAALREYLESLNQDAGAPAGTTVVHVTDGHETRRDNGDEGRAIDYNPLMEQVESWVMSGQGSSEVTVSFRMLQPQLRYERSYTSSEAGLRAYVNDAARAQNATIVVQQTSGNGWSARADSSRGMPSASTYKLYIAWMLFNRIDNGDTRWNDSMLDTTVSGCFDRMIIASTNACAEAWIGQFGRANINNFLHSRGYSGGTSFTNQIATHTTADDLARFLIALERGENIRGANRDRLLHSMAIHPFRQGVPAGSAGTVRDKVGFLWDYVHDAAIVHHPRGNYVIVVMTKGRSYQTIADITRQVERIMY